MSSGADRFFATAHRTSVVQSLESSRRMSGGVDGLSAIDARGIQSQSRESSPSRSIEAELLRVTDFRT